MLLSLNAKQSDGSEAFVSLRGFKNQLSRSALGRSEGRVALLARLTSSRNVAQVQLTMHKSHNLLLCKS